VYRVNPVFLQKPYSIYQQLSAKEENYDLKVNNCGVRFKKYGFRKAKGPKDGQYLEVEHILPNTSHRREGGNSSIEKTALNKLFIAERLRSLAPLSGSLRNVSYQ